MFCTRFQLLGTGFSLLEGIDPNPDNFVLAGVIHTSAFQTGCLFRLEPNKQANVSIWDVRFSREQRKISLYICTAICVWLCMYGYLCMTMNV